MTRPTNHVRELALAVVLLTVAAACGGGPSSELTTGTEEQSSSVITNSSTTEPPSGQTPTPEPDTSVPDRPAAPPEPTVSGAPSGQSQTTAPAPKKAAIKVAYPGGGPADTMFPGNEDAFGLLEERKCTELRSSADEWNLNEGIRELHGTAIDLYRGAAAACLMMWEDAKADLAKVKSADVDSCDRQVALKFLQEMVAAHDSNPDAAPDISEPGPSCPETTDEPTSSSSTTSEFATSGS